MRRLSVTLAGSYCVRTLDNLLTELQPVHALNTPAIVDLDLRRLEDITAAPLALTVAALRTVAARGLVLTGSRYLPPEHEPTKQFLARMGFERLLVEPWNQPDGLPPGFQRCRAFGAEHELDAVVTALA